MAERRRRRRSMPKLLDQVIVDSLTRGTRRTVAGGQVVEVDLDPKFLDVCRKRLLDLREIAAEDEGPMNQAELAEKELRKAARRAELFDGLGPLDSPEPEQETPGNGHQVEDLRL